MIRLKDVINLHHQSFQQSVRIHVFHRLVETSPIADLSVTVLRVLVYQITLAVHRTADQNALLTLTVHQINHVLLNVVVIHVKALVA